MTRKTKLVLLSAATILLAGCGGALSAVGHPEPQPAPETVLPPMVTAAAASHPTSNSAIDDAQSAKAEAEMVCNLAIDSIPRQVVTIKTVAYNRKQAGLLVTTLVGAAGSVVTAALAATQKDSNGNANATPATVVGASTAGATSLAGVISLFVVGTGTDDRIALMTEYGKDLNAAVVAYEGTCATINETNTGSCKTEAGVLRRRCVGIACNLPYQVPGITSDAACQAGRAGN